VSTETTDGSQVQQTAMPASIFSLFTTTTSDETVSGATTPSPGEDYTYIFQPVLQQSPDSFWSSSSAELTRRCIELQQNTLVFQQHLQVSNDCLVLQGLLLEHEEADYLLLLLNHYYSEWNRLQLAELVVL
jgi:hypothetical protein